MKQLLILILFTASFLAGCDKVPPRVPPPKPECVMDSDLVVVNTNTAVSNSKKVLIEEYTGQRCGQCPPAAVKLEQLLETYPRLIAITHHVTDEFAKPKGAYLPDFRNEASNEWDSKSGFTVSNSGLPKGTVNRKKVGQAYAIPFTTWETNITPELAKPQTVKLDVTTTYDPSQKLLNVKVFTTFLSDFPADVNLIMALTQDSIISSQTDYAPPAGVEVVDGDRRPDYKFDHIMVKTLNGTWGQAIKSGVIAKNDTATVTKNCNLASKCFYKDEICTNDKNLYLVVFAYDSQDRSVLQVEKVKLRK